MIDASVAFQSLPRPVQLAEHKLEVTDWTVPADLPYVDGHFPGRPILPAIGILDASLFLLQAALHEPRLRILRVGAAKFTSPIEPGLRVRIELERRADHEWEVQWLDSLRKSLASLRIHTSA